MSTRVGQPRIKGNTTYYRLVTDDDETPVRLHDDIAEIIDRLGPEECSVGKVEVRYINSRGEEKRAEIQFDSDGTHRDVYRTWQYSQQSGREIPLWFFNVKYRGNKFRIKLDVPNQRMAIAVSTRDEDTSVFDEFMRSLEGKNDWSHRQPPRQSQGRATDMDEYVNHPYDDGYDEDKLDASDMANLVDDGYDQGGYDDGYDDGYGQGGYDDQGYDDGYGQGGYDDGYDQEQPYQMPQNQQLQKQDGGPDPFGKYCGLALTEVIITSIAGLALIILLNMETHLGISITSVLFCGFLLIAPLIAVSALVRVFAAHNKIKDDYLKGMRGYDKAKHRMIAVLILMLVWVVALGYLGFLWYTHSLPPQLSGIYDLLDHKI